MISFTDQELDYYFSEKKKLRQAEVRRQRPMIARLKICRIKIWYLVLCFKNAEGLTLKGLLFSLQFLLTSYQQVYRIFNKNNDL